MKDLDQLIESAVSSRKQEKGIPLDLNTLLEMVSEVISEEKGDNLKSRRQRTVVKRKAAQEKCSEVQEGKKTYPSHGHSLPPL